jgi:hypothetical protein
MFHTFFKLGDKYCRQTALGYQYYADRSTLRLVTNITLNACRIHCLIHSLNSGSAKIEVFTKLL